MVTSVQQTFGMARFERPKSYGFEFISLGENSSMHLPDSSTIYTPLVE